MLRSHRPVLSSLYYSSPGRGSQPAYYRIALISRQLLSDSAMSSQQRQEEILKWASTDGEFRRKPSSYRKFISRESGAEYPPEKGRYHLYISWACPWAHRTAIVRKLKGLEDIIGLSVVDWYLGEMGWKFSTPDETPGSIIDPVHNSSYLRELYFRMNPDHNGRFTVPVLWDKKTDTLVNNESSEIIRMFNEEFDDLVDDKFKGVTFYPKSLRKDIDELNEWVYDTVNNGVYKSGFATKQEVYESHVVKLFKSLDRLEDILAKSTGPYLFDDVLTEADIRLYTTIIRFDPVYVQHFKCNIGTIRDNYPQLHKWVRHLYWDIPEFKDTTNFEHIKKHYTKSHRQINPFGITPVGPLPDIKPK
ncbi:glutathione S-transferase [Lipomyces orientalis]|uniref:Glutathione S-transferase n=1 Tax=Lipomyces orientalis TaxID=1233043 RepID=A0ACC3TGT9_9ASCO